MKTTTMVNFSFIAEELPTKLISAATQIQTGNCQLKLTYHDHGNKPVLWYLTIVQGRVVFSGIEPLRWTSFLRLLQRYLVHLRTAKNQNKLAEINQSSSHQELKQIGTMIRKLEQENLISYEQVLKSIQTQLLVDLDTYLFQSTGSGEFIPEPELVYQAQIPGFPLEDLISKAKQRQQEWESLKAIVPSMDCCPYLYEEKVKKSRLSPAQKRQIILLASSGKTLREIAEKMGKDSLELAKVFSKLVQSNLLTLELPRANACSFSTPGIFIVDDSPLIIEQFKTLVTGWGYRVVTCQNPLMAVAQMLNDKPAKIFVDINMPRLSGFDLIKQIRRQTDLADIPLVLLTAENSVSNQWRARWASCQFLSKPRSRDEVSVFRAELKKILPQMETNNDKNAELYLNKE